MRNLLFTFPIHFFTELLYITCHIYRDIKNIHIYKTYITGHTYRHKKYIANITILMIVINYNSIHDNNNDYNYNKTQKSKKKAEKISSHTHPHTHTHTHKTHTNTKLHKNLANFNILIQGIHSLFVTLSNVKSSQVNFISKIRIYNYKIYNFQKQK